MANNCQDAEVLAVPSVTSGNTDEEAPINISPDCFFDQIPKKGIWYRIQPPVNREITIKTCASCFDTSLSIYSASCNSLTCLLNNDDVTEDCILPGEDCADFASLVSEISFCSTANDYLILLSGFGDSSGEYTLTIEISSDQCSPPDNQECATAIEILSQSPPVPFSTQFASSGNLECNGITEYGEHSVWYKVPGTGGAIIASTCFPDTTFSTSIAVFEGNCGSLTCVASSSENSVSCVQGYGTAVFCTDIDVDYYLFITGFFGESGNGLLSITNTDPCLDEVRTCSKPMRIDVEGQFDSFFEFGETIENPNPVLFPSCDLSGLTGETVHWFTWRGNGNILSVNTEFSDIDTVLSVFSGSCFDLQCVKWNNNEFCGPPGSEICTSSSVSFCGAGTDYFIAVGGVNDATGIYAIYAEIIGPCVQSGTCTGTSVLSSGTTFGDLRLLEPLVVDFDFCGDVFLEEYNAWFSYIGSNLQVQVDTCGSCFDTYLVVFESLDGCDDLRCIVSNNDSEGQCGDYSFGTDTCEVEYESSFLSFCGGEEIEYYIIVGGVFEGTFTLTIEENQPCLSNEQCDFAISIELEEEAAFRASLGEMTGIQTILECGEESEGIVSGWYSIIGSGNIFSVSSTTSDSMVVLVFTSTDGSCSGIPDICIGSGIADTSSVEFCTKSKEKYFISIGGNNPDENTIYSFLITELGGCIDVENQICENRETFDVSLNAANIFANNLFSGGETISFICDGVLFKPPGYLWYSIVGTGRTISANLQNSDFDASIAVIEASCEYRTCVASYNDPDSSLSSVSFCGITEIEYLILVTGSAPHELGDFHLIIQEHGFCPINNVCTKSTELSIPSTTFGSTKDSLVLVDIVRYQIPLECIQGTGFINTQWFSFLSTEKSMVEVDVLMDSFVEPIIGLYTAQCITGRTECATFIDNQQSIFSQLSFCGDYDENLYLMITSYNDRRSDFTISINYTPIACSNVQQASTCQEANIISQIPHQAFGSFAGTSLLFDFDCIGSFYPEQYVGQSVIGHTWYIISGTGQTIKADAIATQGNLKFIVYEHSCDPDDCIAFTPAIDHESKWCSEPEIEYFVLLVTIGQEVISNYQISFEELETCIGVPEAPLIITESKSSSSLTFTWEIPFAFGFPIEYYSYTFTGTYSDGIFQEGNTTDTKITFENLIADKNFEFVLFANNKFGSGDTTLFNETTASFGCVAEPVAFIDTVKVDIFESQGIVISPDGLDVIIHSVTVQVHQLYGNEIELSLAESNYELPDHFTVIDTQEREIYDYFIDSAVTFADLEWNLCSNKRYIIFVRLDGELYQAQDTEGKQTCLGVLQGISVDVDENLAQDTFWLNSVVLNGPLFFTRLEADVSPATNSQPSEVEIENISATVSTVTIQWNEPCSSSPIESYRIEIIPSFQVITLPRTETTFTFTNLDPQGVYDVQIVAVNNFGESIPSTAQITTLSSRYSVQWLTQSGPSLSSELRADTKVVMDPNRFSYVIGSFSGQITIGPRTLTSKALVVDCFLAKFSPDGVFVWVVHIGRSEDGSTYCRDVSVDSFGDVSIVGTFTEETMLGDSQTPLTTVQGSNNVFVAKYLSNSTFLFSKHLGDTQGYDHEGNTITIDSENRLLISGLFSSAVDLVSFSDDSASVSRPNNDDDFGENLFVFVWEATGEFVSSFAIYGSEYSFVSGNSITTDEQNNVYIIGQYSGEVINGPLELPYGEGFLIAKFDDSFVPVWLFGFGGEISTSYATDIVYQGNNLFVSCISDADDDFSIRTAISVEYIDIPPKVITLSSVDGSVIWTTDLEELAAAEPLGVAVTSGNTIIVTGRYEVSEGINAFFIGLDLISGNMKWQRWAGSSFYDQTGTGVAAIGTEVTAVGSFQGSSSFDCSLTTTSNTTDVFIVRLLPSQDTTETTSPDEPIECGTNLYTSRLGTIKFPSTAEPYPNSFECEWLIQVPNVPHIMAIIKSFELADSSDSLTFYDGATRESKILHFYNGDNAIVKDNNLEYYDNYYNRDELMIQSTSNSLLIVFRSGECFRASGFELSFESAQQESFCDNYFEQRVTLRSGLISQRQKGGYRDSSDCFFYITPESAKFVLLEFQKFDLAEEDYIEIIHESSSSSESFEILATFHGGDDTYPVQSISGSVIIHFVSDSYGYEKGFIIKYEGISVPIYCEPDARYSTKRGALRSHVAKGNYPPFASCSWDIDIDETQSDSIYVFFTELQIPFPGSLTIDLALEESTIQSRDQLQTSIQTQTQSQQVFATDELLISHNPSFALHFNANGTQSDGFTGEYCAHPIGGACKPEIYTTANATFDNHFCGLFYEANSNCEWTFAPMIHQSTIRHLMITFPLIDFHNDPETEENTENATDFLSLYEGPRDGPFVPVATITSSDTNTLTFITTQEAFKSIFQSDSEGFGHGFNASACASIVNSPNECNGMNSLSGSDGEFNNYFCGFIHGAEASCGWKFAEKPNSPISRVMLIFNNIQFANEPWNGIAWGDSLTIAENNVPHTIFNRGGSHEGSTPSQRQEIGSSISTQEVFSFDSASVSVTFVSNSVGFVEGFSAQYCSFSASDSRICSGTRTYHSQTGILHNHACGKLYQANANCQFVISPSGAEQKDVILFLTSVDFKGPDDSIVLYDGLTASQQFKVAEFNQEKSYYDSQGSSSSPYFPKTFISSRGGFLIGFKSDDKLFGEGFDAEFCSVNSPAATCGGVQRITNHTGILVDRPCGPSYYSPMDCQWTISPENQNFTFIALIFRKLDLGTDATLTVTDTQSGKQFTSQSSEYYLGDEDLVDENYFFDFDYYSSDTYWDDYFEEDEDEDFNFFDNFDDSLILEGSAVFIKSSEAKIHFDVSSSAVLKSGWEIEYLTVTETGICSGEQIYTNPQGFIEDHSYGKFYSNSQICNFLITIPTASTITVRFETFSLEDGFDFLEVYDGNGWQSELIAFHSGSSKPSPFTSSSNSLYFTFRTDETFVDRGFRLFYSDSALTDCPLFCSGVGSCVNNSCVCDDNRFGVGCEIFPAPIANDAQFTDSLDSITISFDRDTNRAGMFGTSSNDCLILLSANSLSRFGFRPICLWVDDKTFVIRVGNEPTILPGDQIEINGNLIQDPNPSELHPFAPAIVLTISTATKPSPPQVIIVGITILESGKELELDASTTYLTGGRRPFFNWSIDENCFGNTCVVSQKLKDYVASQHGEDLVVPANFFKFFPPGTSIPFVCSAVNFLGMESEPKIHIIHTSASAIPMTVIAGPKSLQVARNENIVIRTYVQVETNVFDEIVNDASCIDVSWQWTVTCMSEYCVNQTISLPSSVITSKADLFIPHSTLDFDTKYLFSIELTTEDESGNEARSAEFISVEIIPFILDIEVPGGTQVISQSNPIRLGAQLVESQQQLSGLVNYRWACRKSSGYLCQQQNNEFLILPDSDSFEIPPQSLPPGDYIFTVLGTFNSSLRSDSNNEDVTVSTDREEIAIRVLRRDQPLIRILRVGAGKQDSRLPLVLQSEADSSVIRLQWSVVAGDLVLDDSTVWSEDTSSSELVIAPNVLQDGATYRFQLTGSSISSENFAVVEILVNSAPAAARLSVEPQSGFSLETKFVFSVSGGSDDLSDMPLRYVFGVFPISCAGTELPNGNCALIPISNTAEYPRFSALLPAGEYSPVVDIFDRFGSFRRVIAPFTITSYDTCPVTPDLMLTYMTRLARTAKAFGCLGDSDSVRQVVNIASVSLSCVSFDVPDDVIEVYFNELSPVLLSVDKFIQSTEIFVDNQVKSLLLSSTIPLANRQSDVGSLLSNTKRIADAASGEGFLRSDSSSSLLNGLSNILGNGIDATDVSTVFETLKSIGAGELLQRTCDTVSSDVQSANINIRNQRQSPSVLAGSELSAGTSNSGTFKIPNSASSSASCVNYIVADYEMKLFQDGESTTVSIPFALTLTDSNNEEIQFSLSESPIEIQIPIQSSDTEGIDTTNGTFVCSSWNESTEKWEENCSYLREENGFYIMETYHLTTFSVLFTGVNGGGSGGEVSISTFGSFASYFTGATEIFGASNLDDFGNLVSSFTALSDIPTEAFDTSNEVYDLLQYESGTGDVYSRLYAWLSLSFVLFAILVVLIGAILIDVRYRLKNRKTARTLKSISEMQERPSL